jgi:hypothetical protein
VSSSGSERFGCHSAEEAVLPIRWMARSRRSLRDSPLLVVCGYEKLS